MSKAARIPDAWPLQMTDVAAARYCDMSVSQFHLLVEQEKLPAGRKVFGTNMVRWYREDLSAAISAQFGASVDRNVGAGAASEGAPAIDLDKELGIG